MYSSAKNFLDLVEAAKNNDLDVVQDLMWACDPKQRNSLPFITAAQYGSLECLEALKTVSDHTANKSEALMKAANFGHLECVKFLWRLAIPQLENRGFIALCFAAGQGHNSVVSYILEQGVDPALKFSIPLCRAALGGYTDTVELLYPVSRPDEALLLLRSQNGAQNPKWQWFEDFVNARKQKTILNAEICTGVTLSAPRKI